MASRDHAPNTCAATPKSAAPEMVQRIAVRLWMQETHASEPRHFDSQPQDIQRYWRDGARIAIEAMIEPISDMRWAAVQAVCAHQKAASFSDSGELQARLVAFAVGTYQIMVLAALRGAHDS